MNNGNLALDFGSHVNNHNNARRKDFDAFYFFNVPAGIFKKDYFDELRETALMPGIRVPMKGAFIKRGIIGTNWVSRIGTAER